MTSESLACFGAIWIFLLWIASPCGHVGGWLLFIYVTAEIGRTAIVDLDVCSAWRRRIGSVTIWCDESGVQYGVGVASCAAPGFWIMGVVPRSLGPGFAVWATGGGGREGLLVVGGLWALAFFFYSAPPGGILLHGQHSTPTSFPLPG
jgi:hypothetical protein